MTWGHNTLSGTWMTFHHTLSGTFKMTWHHNLKPRWDHTLIETLMTSPYSDWNVDDMTSYSDWNVVDDIILWVKRSLFLQDDCYEYVQKEVPGQWISFPKTNGAAKVIHVSFERIRVPKKRRYTYQQDNSLFWKQNYVRYRQDDTWEALDKQDRGCRLLVHVTALAQY